MVPEPMPNDLARLMPTQLSAAAGPSESTAVFEDECSGIALTPAQFGVLRVLRASPGRDQSSLASCRPVSHDHVKLLDFLILIVTDTGLANCPENATE